MGYGIVADLQRHGSQRLYSTVQLVVGGGANVWFLSECLVQPSEALDLM